MRKVSGSFNVVSFAALGVALPLLYSLRNLPNMMYLVWSVFSESDLGNVIAALVAVGGYMMEHWNTREAQKLEAQMQRVSSQSQMLLVPITMHLQALMIGSLYYFIDSHFDEAKEYIATEYDDPDYGAKVGKFYLQSPIMEVPTDLRHSESAAFWMTDVMLADFVEAGGVPGRSFLPAVSAPSELPKFLHAALKECKKPEATLWKSYESFIRCELLPAVDRVAEIINEYGHLMEPVPAARLKEMYGREGTGMGQKWTIAPRMFFYSMWLAYARSWHTLVEQWDNGIYHSIRPNTRFPVGLLFFNIEGQTIVAGVEKQLVGMSQMHGSVGDQKSK